MVLMRKQTVAALEDFRYICIECPHCHAKVTLDMQEKSEFADKHNIFAPKRCPGCDTAYDTSIQPNADNLQLAYSETLDIADRISFLGEPKTEPVALSYYVNKEERISL